MTIRIAVAFLVLSIAATLQAAEPVLRAELFMLKPEQIPHMEEAALLGDVASAEKLSNYYDIIKRDPEKSMYWLQLCAENGGVVCQYNFGFLLHESRSASDKVRAKFWLEKASKGGNVRATELIRLLGRKK